MQRAVLRTGQNHALRQYAAQFDRFQIGHHNHMFTDQFFRLIMLRDTAHDAAFFIAQGHRQMQ